MALADDIMRCVGQPILQWSHADAELVDWDPPSGSPVAQLAAIRGDEQWIVTEDSGFGERRQRTCWWSLRRSDVPTPAVRGRIRVRATNELWEVLEVLSADAVYVRLQTVRVEPHEFTRARRRPGGSE